MYQQVQLPRCLAGSSDRAAIAADVAAWIDSPPLADLAECFGAKAPIGGDVAMRLRQWDEISARLWNFRGGRSRAEARASAEDLRFSTIQERQTLATAAALGMVAQAAPTYTEYDHVLVLGSYLDACVQRAERAAGLVKDSISTRAVHGLSSLRPFEECDRTAAAYLGMASEETEFGALDAALRRAFGLGEPLEDGTHHDGFTEMRSLAYVTGAGLPVSVLAGRVRRAGQQRANTADTFHDWALAHAHRGARLLLVTTTYFVPFQHCDAARMLGLEWQCGIDTIGVDPAVAGDVRLRRPLTVADHLMEIGSAIRAMRALWEAAVAPGA